MTQPRTPEEINKLVQEYRERGDMTRRTFCESRGISLPTLDYYLRRYRKPAVRLAKVEVKPAAVERAGRFALVLGNGRRIECSEAELPQMIRIAEVQ